MKNLIRIFLIVLIAGSAIGLHTSCSEDNDCSMDGRPMIYCNLFTIDPETKQQLNDTLDSLTITAFGTDSIILNNQKNVHSLMLPLRYTKDSTVFILRYDYPTFTDRSDTLILTYSNIPYFQSIECGYMMKQTLTGDSIRKTKNKNQKYQLESIKVLSKEANSHEIKNLQLFYKYHN